MSLYLSSEYVVINCGADGCDQTFAVTRRFYDWTHEGNGWYCPRGHPRVWKSQTTAQKLQVAEATNVQLAAQLRAAEAEKEAHRVTLIRDRHRFANGVCPCCNRSFETVARHMKTQHPDYDPGHLQSPWYACSCGRKFDTPTGLRIHQGKSRDSDWTNPKRGQYGRHLTVVGAR